MAADLILFLLNFDVTISPVQIRRDGRIKSVYDGHTCLCEF